MLENTLEFEKNPYPQKELEALQKDSHILTNDEHFLRLAIAQNAESGCDALFRKYYQVLCNHAVRFVYDKAMAEDLVSELFYDFWRLKLYDRITISYRLYLFRAIRNRCYNHIARKYQYNQPLDEGREVSDTETPENIMQMEELTHSIELIIRNLPSQCQKVFLMSRIEGKRQKEISNALGISLKTIEAHISKAVKTIKNQLKNH
jgi:RNA polymerase sigma-70 factor (ECF subfamily)